MNSAERSIFNSHQRVLRAADLAREWFKTRNPILWAKIEITLDDERQDILDNSEPPEFAVGMFDCRAKAYLECVEPGNIESYDHYLVILNAGRLRLVKAAFGVGAGAPVVFNGSDIDNALMERLRHWRKEAYSRLTSEESTSTSIPKRAEYRSEMDEWMEKSGIANLDEAARTLAIGVDALKSIRSNKGTARYGDDTLRDFLTKTGIARK